MLVVVVGMGDQKVPMFATNYIIQLRHSLQKGGEGYIHVLRGHKLVSYFRNIHNSHWIPQPFRQWTNYYTISIIV